MDPTLTRHVPGQSSAFGQARIAADVMIPDLLRARPHLRPVFDRYGLRGCGGAYGPAETVAYFAGMHGV